MLRFPLRFLFFLLPGLVEASSSLESARQAAAMVGTETWHRVLRIENAERRNGYPATVHALVFEFGGLLWFYSDAKGTQSFSQHVDDLAAEKADLAPLVRGVDPGFGAFTIVPDDAAPVSRPRSPPPNACFIESVAALRERVARGEAIVRARLLSFYGATAAGGFGHTILTYETPSGAFVLDPQESRWPRRVSRALLGNPKRLAEKARPEATVTLARWVPTSLRPSAPLLAAAERVAAGVPRGATLMK